MKMKALILALLLASPAAAQPPAGPWDPAARMAAQREAMKRLDFLDGAWRGPAQASDAPSPLVQTERVGPLLDRTVKLVEGRGYDAEGRTVFNAFAIISYDPVKRAYALRTYSTGFVGDYPLTVRPDGFSWSHPAGPGATMRYTATVRDGEWHEVGERVAEGSPPVKAIELRVRRVGASPWPRQGAVPPR
jgi:hypothetical protein